MRRFLFFFFCYAMVFITGYLVMGILSTYYKPIPKTLPTFIRIA